LTRQSEQNIRSKIQIVLPPFWRKIEATFSGCGKLPRRCFTGLMFQSVEEWIGEWIVLKSSAEISERQQ
jgi:hypothetical protein